MSIRKNTFIVIFMISVLIFIVHPGRAIDTERCKVCHGYVKPLSPITRDCTMCHIQADHQDSPSRRDSGFVHDKHAEIGKFLTQERCTICHHRPECTNCHNIHEIAQSTKGITKDTTNDTRDAIVSTVNTRNISDCIDCHGQLPQPTGHDNFRDALSKSKHRWMNCGTCHVNVYTIGKGNEFRLHFKDLFSVKIEDSVSLCKICHSFQYGKMKNGEHGKLEQKCVDCHNPHTTDFKGSKLSAPEQSQVNISAQVDSAGDWITTKVPILKNTTALFIIIIVIGVTIAEHILSAHEEGKKIAYNTIKFQESEDTLNTLEVKLKTQDTNAVRDILETNDISILGMTMKKEDDKGLNIYKYVIFVNMLKPLDTKSLADKISTMDNVKSAIFTDRYEL